MFKQKLAGVAAKLRPWYGLIGKVLFLIVTLIILFGFVFGFNRMSGIAMSSNINDGDLTLFTRIGNDYAENDVVIYERDGKSSISRIIAKSGQIVDINNEGYMTVDGAVVSKAPVTNDLDTAALDMGLPYRVGSNMVYLLNDNYELNDDSRSFGAVFTSFLKGKIITVLKVRGI